MRDNANRTTSRSGFTLIELLVVVAIIVIIAAILFPAFATVRERGRRTVCQSNLKQIAIAMQQYVQDNGGAYPLLGGSEVENGKMKYLGWRYVIYPYIEDEQVFHCPSSEGDNFDSLGQRQKELSLRLVFTSYSYNSERLNDYSLTSAAGHISVKGVQESVLRAPSTIWLNKDDGWIDGNGQCKDCQALKTSDGRWFNGSGIHSGGGNYSFLDGHVKWYAPDAMVSLESSNGHLPPPFKN